MAPDERMTDRVALTVIALVSSLVVIAVGVLLAGRQPPRAAAHPVSVLPLVNAWLNGTSAALLTAGYTASFTSTIAASPQASSVSEQTQVALEKSFAGAVNIAETYPQYAQQIIAAARSAFLDGDTRAYAAAIGIVLIGAALVFFVFPKHDAETALLERYAAEDAETGGRESGDAETGDRAIGEAG